MGDKRWCPSRDFWETLCTVWRSPTGEDLAKEHRDIKHSIRNMEMKLDFFIKLVNDMRQAPEGHMYIEKDHNVHGD